MENLATRLLGIIISCNLCCAFPIEDTVIQFQHSRVDGAETVHVFINGISQDASGSPLWTDGADSLPVIAIEEERQNHTIRRIRGCRMHGVQVHLTDQILYDGKIYLTLDSDMNTWASETPDGVALLNWVQDPERTRQERMQLEEGCIKLMEQLQLRSESKTADGSAMAIVIICVTMALLLMIATSYLISERYGTLGWTGVGVIGSIAPLKYHVTPTS